MHTPRLKQSNELIPSQNKWNCPFRWKTNSVLCASAIIFQKQSTMMNEKEMMCVKGVLVLMKEEEVLKLAQTLTNNIIEIKNSEGK